MSPNQRWLIDDSAKSGVKKVKKMKNSTVKKTIKKATTGELEAKNKKVKNKKKKKNQVSNLDAEKKPVDDKKNKKEESVHTEGLVKAGSKTKEQLRRMRKKAARAEKAAAKAEVSTLLNGRGGSEEKEEEPSVRFGCREEACR